MVSSNRPLKSENHFCWPHSLTKGFIMEWLIPEPTTPVRQGDILICRDPKSGTIEHTHIVITADCDISKEKFGRHLAVLRVISHEQYIFDIWGEKKLAKLQKDEREKLRGQIAKWHSNALGRESTLTEQAAMSWLLREEPEQLCAELCVPVREKKKFTRSMVQFKEAFIRLEADKSLQSLKRYVNFLAILRAETFTSVLSKTLAQAHSDALPDDTFFLPELPEGGSNGAIVMLREILGIPVELICYRAHEAKSKDSFLRIARLKPDLKYAISQAFGSLYSRIGLSSEYEARCKAALAKTYNYGWDVAC